MKRLGVHADCLALSDFLHNWKTATCMEWCYQIRDHRVHNLLLWVTNHIWAILWRGSMDFTDCRGSWKGGTTNCCSICRLIHSLLLSLFNLYFPTVSCIQPSLCFLAIDGTHSPWGFVTSAHYLCPESARKCQTFDMLRLMLGGVSTPIHLQISVPTRNGNCSQPVMICTD